MLLKNSIIDQENALAIGLRKKSFLKLHVVHLQLEFAKPFDNSELIARLGVGRRFVDMQKKLAERVDDLKSALDHVKRLQGILPICMYCHKIRKEKKSWERIEQYISDNSDAEFSHSICPECMDKHHPETKKK